MTFKENSRSVFFSLEFLFLYLGSKILGLFLESCIVRGPWFGGTNHPPTKLTLTSPCMDREEWSHIQGPLDTVLAGVGEEDTVEWISYVKCLPDHLTSPVSHLFGLFCFSPNIHRNGRVDTGVLSWRTDLQEYKFYTCSSGWRVSIIFLFVSVCTL